MQRLTVGVMGNSLAIRTLLTQVGVPWLDVHAESSPQAEEFAIVLWLGGSGQDKLAAYLAGGGAVLLGARATWPAMAQENVPVRDGGGWLQRLPVAVETEILEHDAAIHVGHTAHGFTVRERLACTPKAPARRALFQALASLADARGIPLAWVWFYPATYRSVFAIRVDADGVSREEWALLAETLDAAAVPSTWFVNGFGYRDASWVGRAMRGVKDLQSHGADHFVYGTEKLNRENLRAFNAWLRTTGAERPISGFAAPTGRWTPALDRALAHEGIQYSSDFSIDYDNFPWYPVREGEISPVLQVPIHPVCFGVMQQLSNINQATAYFEAVVAEKRACCEPIYIYTHPAEINPETAASLAQVCEAVKRSPDVWLASMTEFAAWWERRSSMNAEVFWDGVRCHFGLASGEATLALTVKGEHRLIDGHAVSATMADGFAVAMQIAPHLPISLKQEPLSATRRLRERVKQWLDWDRELYHHQVEATTPRAWIRKVGKWYLQR